MTSLCLPMQRAVRCLFIKSQKGALSGLADAVIPAAPDCARTPGREAWRPYAAGRVLVNF